jgi:hypothetical protein
MSKWAERIMYILLNFGCVMAGCLCVLTIANAPEFYRLIIASIAIASWVIMAMIFITLVCLDIGPSNVG